MKPEFRCGSCAIVGAPNVGKSTLLNALVGEHLAIVSRKPQSTRASVKGIIHLPDAQLIFVDTAGLTAPKDPLRRVLQRHVAQEVLDADVLLWLVAPRLAHEPALSNDETRALESFGAKPFVLAINKIDLSKNKAPLLRWLSFLDGAAKPQALVPISARRRDGLDGLCRELVRLLPVGPARYPEDEFTDQTERQLVSEMVREEIYARLNQEVPYACAVEIETYNKTEAGVRVLAYIVVTRRSQKAILVGKGGANVKAIGSHARAKLSRLLGCPVALFLEVTVAEGWTDSEAEVSRLVGG